MHVCIMRVHVSILLGVKDRLCSLHDPNPVETEEKHAGMPTASPRKMYNVVKEGVRSKLHIV